MAIPTNRAGLKAWALRKLGSDVLEINTSDDQLEDRIDEALQYWREFHDDAVSDEYFIHQVTQTDIDNEFFTLSPALNIAYITHVLPISYRGGYTDRNMFNVEYQIRMFDLFDLSKGSGMVNYVQARQYLAFLDDTFRGEEHFSYSYHENIVQLRINWADEVAVDDYVVMKGYRFVDETLISNVWNDRWLKNYTTELFRKQWGTNLIKFDGVALIGGVTMNGERILRMAEEAIDKLELEAVLRYQKPPDFFVG